jgi:hypothetical protein
MDDTLPRVRGTGGWSLVVGREFEVRDNGDSVQAVNGDRIVYLSSLRVGSPVPAAKLRALAASRLGSGERLSHVAPSVQGDAELRYNNGAWQLRGTMAADGTVATCVVDFRAASDRPWAISVWKSLLCDGVAA